MRILENNGEKQQLKLEIKKIIYINNGSLG